MKKPFQNDRSPVNKRDFILIFSLLVVAAAALSVMRFSSGTLTAHIIYDGVQVMTAELDKVNETTVFSPVDGVEIEISKDGIRFVSSTCKSQQCVNCGLLTKAGQSAVCIPNRVMITLTSSGSNSTGTYDAVAY